MTGKNSGLRPKELQSLRWSDVDIISMGPRSSSDKREHLVAEIASEKQRQANPGRYRSTVGHNLLNGFNTRRSMRSVIYHLRFQRYGIKMLMYLETSTTSVVRLTTPSTAVAGLWR